MSKQDNNKIVRITVDRDDFLAIGICPARYSDMMGSIALSTSDHLIYLVSLEIEKDNPGFSDLDSPSFDQGIVLRMSACCDLAVMNGLQNIISGATKQIASVYEYTPTQLIGDLKMAQYHLDIADSFFNIAIGLFRSATTTIDILQQTGAADDNGNVDIDSHYRIEFRLHPDLYTINTRSTFDFRRN